jgi:hypothetical protein
MGISRLLRTIVLASVFASVFAMTAVEAQIPGLIHRYPGDVDGSDAVGTSPGTFENGTTAGTPGRVGGAFLFDGIDDGVNLGNVPDLDYSATSSFTWEAWVNSFGSSAQPLMFIVTANYQCSFSSQLLAILGSFFGPDVGKVYSRVCDETSCVELVSPSPICFNVWNHIVFVREVSPSGKLLKIYVNCALVATIQDMTIGSLTTNGDDFIGRRFLCPTTGNFDGLIDEVRFYNRALTDAEVCLAYTAGGGGGGCPGADTDGDALLDSTEIDMAMGSGCPSPLDADSDNDGLNDGSEVAGGTNLCSADTDGDGVPDGTDPLPLQPGVPCGFLESTMRSVGVEIEALSLSLFNGPNANANKGRRNSLATRVQNAANGVCDGQEQNALTNLNGVLEKVDGDEPTPDWMFDSPEKTALRESIELLISLTE